MPSEEWGPYKALWSEHLVLARDEYTGRPVPWTHGVRRHWRVWVPAFVVLVAWQAWGARSKWWRVVCAFLTGLLAGHFFW